MYYRSSDDSFHVQRLLPTRTNQGHLLKVVCCMISVLFCFSYLYLKLLFFEKGGLTFSIFSYFKFNVIYDNFSKQ